MSISKTMHYCQNFNYIALLVQNVVGDTNIEADTFEVELNFSESIDW